MIILASASPRRQELLARLTPDFKAVPAQIDERALPMLPPVPYVAQLAEAKGREVAGRYPDETVLAADTMVTFQDKLLGKPADRADAKRMIRALAGNTHHVHTGLWLGFPGGTTKHTVVTTAVTFWSLTDEQIDQYLAKGSYVGKAGAYGIQDDGALLIEKIDGDFYNVMGLPISTLARLW